MGYDPSAPFGTNPTQGTLDGSSLTPLPNGPCDEGSIGEIRQDVIEGCVLVNYLRHLFAGVTGEFATASRKRLLIC